jgi:anhydro-N-acetylmuramic acid kinase
VHNRTLLAMLQDLLSEQKVLNSGEIGFSDDAKEAIIFALLGNDSMHGISNNLPSATGADRLMIMGKPAFQ